MITEPRLPKPKKKIVAKATADGRVDCHASFDLIADPWFDPRRYSFPLATAGNGFGLIVSPICLGSVGRSQDSLIPARLEAA